MSTTKKAIMVIESRILVDGKVLSDGHSSHKAAIEVAKKMKEQEEYKDHDILLFPPKKDMNYSPKTFRYRNQGKTEKPINLSEKKVRGSKKDSGKKKDSIEDMEAKLAKAKEDLAKINIVLG